MEFHDDVVVIIGNNGATVTDDGQYYIFFGGYEMAEEFNGVIVKEEEMEMAINHEVLHCVIDSIDEDAGALDNIWCKYDVPRHPILDNCSEMGLGF